jgi:hypothetical protein
MNERWKFVTERKGNEAHLKAIPNPDNLCEYIYKASQELSEKIMRNEEELLLRAMATSALERLSELCLKEIERRK